MEIKNTSENISGWMVVETDDGAEHLIISGVKVARKKEDEIYFYTLGISSMVYRCALMKFLLLGWKEIVALRDIQLKEM